MNYFYLFIGIACGIGGIAILIMLMIPPKRLRDRYKDNPNHPFNDRGYWP
jgi:hypothetical protein